MILIGTPLQQGYNITEIAQKIGQKPSWVSDRLKDLKNEILITTGHFYPTTDTEYQTLKNSIKEHGIITPIIIGTHHTIIDGRNRYQAAQELGHTHIPAIFITNKTKEQEQELKITLNANRRHLTQRQKRQLAETELQKNPTRTNTQIAHITGNTKTIIKNLRTKLHQQNNT